MSLQLTSKTCKNPGLTKKLIVALLLNGTTVDQGKRHDPVIVEFMSCLSLKSPAAARLLQINLPLPSQSTVRRCIRESRLSPGLGHLVDFYSYAISVWQPLMSALEIPKGGLPLCVGVDETTVIAGPGLLHVKIGNEKKVCIVGSCCPVERKDDEACCRVQMIEIPEFDETRDGLEQLKEFLSKYKFGACECCLRV
jgi:hypothetical protein